MKKTIPKSGEPGSRMLVPGRGVVEFNEEGSPWRAWTRYGDSEPNPWLNTPLPKMTYIVGANQGQLRLGVRLRHMYETSYDSSTDQAMAVNLTRCPGDKAGSRWDKGLVSPPGFPGGDFDRGHLIAAEFGAGMEAINLVSMPSSGNRSHKPETARKRGFVDIADLGERYTNTANYLKGTLALRGEFILPNYRLFEIVTRGQVERGIQHGYDVSLRMRPSTISGVTDVIYGELWLDNNVIRYQIDNDVRL